jgi:hypothetical protein
VAALTLVSRPRAPSPADQRRRRQRWHDVRAALCLTAIVGVVFWKVPVQARPDPAPQAVAATLEVTTAP